MQHNRWLHWKIKHGLAHKGRSPAIPFQPVGFIAKALMPFIKGPPALESSAEPERTPAGGRLFKVDVGGSVGPAGKLNET